MTTNHNTKVGSIKGMADESNQHSFLYMMVSSALRSEIQLKCSWYSGQQMVMNYAGMHTSWGLRCMRVRGKVLWSVPRAKSNLIASDLSHLSSLQSYPSVFHRLHQWALPTPNIAPWVPLSHPRLWPEPELDHILMAQGIQAPFMVTWPSCDDFTTTHHPGHLFSCPGTWGFQPSFSLYLWSYCVLTLLLLLCSCCICNCYHSQLRHGYMHPCFMFVPLSPSSPCGQPP